MKPRFNPEILAKIIDRIGVIGRPKQGDSEGWLKGEWVFLVDEKWVKHECSVPGDLAMKEQADLAKKDLAQHIYLAEGHKLID